MDTNVFDCILWEIYVYTKRYYVRDSNSGQFISINSLRLMILYLFNIAFYIFHLKLILSMLFMKYEKRMNAEDPLFYER